MKAVAQGHAFLSAEWLAMATGELSVALAGQAAADAFGFTLIEWLEDLPDDAPRPLSGDPALVLEVDGLHASIRYGASPGDRCDLEIWRPYRDSRKRVSMRHGPELQAFEARCRAQGRIRVEGQPPTAIGMLHDVHDRIADRTDARGVD